MVGSESDRRDSGLVAYQKVWYHCGVRALARVGTIALQKNCHRWGVARFSSTVSKSGSYDGHSRLKMERNILWLVCIQLYSRR
jgi:hypothetical protein